MIHELHKRLSGGLMSWNAIALSLVLAIAAPCRADEGRQAPKVGEPAPAIDIAKLLQAPDGTRVDLPSLRGKVVVLEFWATWCGPCVRSIPAMNKLEAVLEEDPIVFLHITDEEESVVTKFLEKTPINGWVGIDVEGATFTNYGISGRPTVAVVGKDGTLLGWSDPRFLALEPEILRDVLANGSSEGLGSTQGSSEDPLEGVVRDTTTGKGGRNLCDIVIHRSDESSAKRQGGGDSRGSWSFDRPLLSHLASFCEVSSARIIAPDKLLDDHYDITALGKNLHTPAMREAVCRLIAATFELSLVREKRVMDVYLLKTIPGREPTLPPSWGGVYTDAEKHLSAPSKQVLERMQNGENYFFTLCPLSRLAGGLSYTVKKPVILELGDLPEQSDGVYSLCFPYPKGDIEAFRKAFEKNVGLTLVPAKREVEVLVVDRASKTH